VDPFDYFVQAGAFPNQQDADAQRAKLAMLGWEARVSEREQNGRTVYRVRMGRFPSATMPSSSRKSWKARASSRRWCACSAEKPICLNFFIAHTPRPEQGVSLS
jgi:cell division protein FtsN